MKLKTRTNEIINYLSASLVALSQLLSVCSSASTITADALSDLTMAPAETAALINTDQQQTLETSIQDIHQNLTFNLDNLGTGLQFESKPAVTAEESVPYWEISPEYNLVTIDGYPISQHLITPQIFIYPLPELIAINDSAGRIATTLQDLLKSPRELDTIPFLPQYNAAQAFHSHLQFLDFQNGQGLRYLVWFSQGIVPVNNNELIYTYQGITNDGTHYISVVLPVSHPDLLANGTPTGNEFLDISSDYDAYLKKVVMELDLQSDSTFFPDLTQLDRLVRSLEIN
jgi:hypothetical protein